MPIPDEIAKAARDLGEALRETPSVQAYLALDTKPPTVPHEAEEKTELKEAQFLLAQAADVLSSILRASYHSLVENQEK